MGFLLLFQLRCPLIMVSTLEIAAKKRNALGLIFSDPWIQPKHEVHEIRDTAGHLNLVSRGII